MRNEQVIFRRNSDVIYANMYPCAVVGTVDLNEEYEVFRASDDDATVVVKKYSLGYVDIPDQVSTYDYIKHHAVIDSVKYRLLQRVDELSAEQIFALAELSYAALDAIAVLLQTKTFRSTYRASIREQIETWMRGESKYRIPLTDKQIRSIIPKRRYY